MNHKLFIAPAILALGLVACSSDKSSSNQNANQDVVVHQEEKVALSVVVLDAATGTPVPNAKVAFSGELSSDLLSIEGVAVKASTLSAGVGSYYVKGGETGSLTVTASADGFLGANKVVAVAEGANTIKVALISKTAEIKGVDVEEVKASVSSTGALAAKKTISAAVAGQEDAVEMTIAKGVVLKDASGKPVTGEVSISIAAFTPSEASAFAVLPADLAVTTEKGDEAVAVVAAFIDINMSNTTGAEVKTLNPAAELVVALDPNAKDPTTGEAFAAGDTLSVWSNSNGVLTYEGTTKVSPEGTVTLSIKHLTSYWVSKDVSTCGDNPPTVVLDGAEGLDLAVEIAGNGQYSLNTNTNGKTTLTLNAFPSSKPNLDIKAILAGSSLATKNAPTVACGSSVLVPVKVPSKSGVVSITIGEQCGDDEKSLVASPSNPVYFYNSQKQLAAIGLSDAAGLVSVTLPYGEYTYDAQSRTNGEHETGKVNVNGKKEISIVFSVECSDLTGAE